MNYIISFQTEIMYLTNSCVEKIKTTRTKMCMQPNKQNEFEDEINAQQHQRRPSQSNSGSNMQCSLTTITQINKEM